MSKLFSPSNLAKVITGTVFTLITVAVNPGIAQIVSTSDADHSFRLNHNGHNCQQIDTQYQETYSFETLNFYINICAKGDRYFYTGEAKQGNIGSTFLPAYPLENQQGYQADNGNITYIVSTVSQEGVLIIKQNGRQIALERALNSYCRQVAYPIGLNIRLQPDDQSQKVATIPYQSQVTLAQIDAQGKPILEQDIDGDLWVQISNPHSGYIFYGTQEQDLSLAEC